MAITNHEQVGKALELLKAGLGTFAEREIKSAIKTGLSPQALRGSLMIRCWASAP